METNIVVALDSFKGSIGAAEASAAVAAGWRTVHPEHHVLLHPMADGGEGTLDAFAAAVPGATRRPVTVTGPDDAPLEAEWLLLPPTVDAPFGTAVVELASTSGIELLGRPPRLRPLDAHTIGFGEAIAAALDHGVSRLVLGIGSSSSTDGGTGMLTALGARFEQTTGEPIRRGGRGLFDLAAGDLSGLRRPPSGGVIVLSDVTNPLLGSRGAAAVFGPQKGATPAEVTSLDEGLARLAAQLVVDADIPGAGAAGGTGYGLLAWGATLSPGAVSVAELVGLPRAIRTASIVITGEGSFDGQSAAGKAPWHVAGLAASAGVPIALVAGRIAPGAATERFASCRSLTDLAGSPEVAMQDPARWLHEAGAELARELFDGPPSDLRRVDPPLRRGRPDLA